MPGIPAGRVSGHNENGIEHQPHQEQGRHQHDDALGDPVRAHPALDEVPVVDGARQRLATGALATAQRFELTALLDRFAQLVESTVGRS